MSRTRPSRSCTGCSRSEFDVPGRPTVTISAPGASTTSYVQGVTVNDRSSPDAWMPGAAFGTVGEATGGGTGAGSGTGAGRPTTIGFRLSGTPDTSWGAADADAPPSYAAGPLTFPPGRTPKTLVATGPNLLGAVPTGQLAWQGPVENGVGSVPGTITPGVTTPQGASAVEWQETDAAANTWIWLDPTASLTGGQEYQATITLQGTGDVYLDFYNGQEDLTSETVQLSSAPVTLTLDAEVPNGYSTPLQVRMADAGPVDLYASGASIQLLTPQASG
ncbi:MAG TPA: hypothetical protein VGG75_01960 [Trebonia sp.]